MLSLGLNSDYFYPAGFYGIYLITKKIKTML